MEFIGHPLEGAANPKLERLLSKGTNVRSYVAASVCYNGDVLANLVSHTTGALWSHSPRWAETLAFSILISDLPREARLCFTVYATADEFSSVPVGWVSLMLMDFRGKLRTGLMGLKVWPYAEANPITTMENLSGNHTGTLFLLSFVPVRQCGKEPQIVGAKKWGGQRYNGQFDPDVHTGPLASDPTRNQRNREWRDHMQSGTARPASQGAVFSSSAGGLTNSEPRGGAGPGRLPLRTAASRIPRPDPPIPRPPGRPNGEVTQRGREQSRWSARPTRVGGAGVGGVGEVGGE